MNDVRSRNAKRRDASYACNDDDDDDDGASVTKNSVKRSRVNIKLTYAYPNRDREPACIDNVADVVYILPASPCLFYNICFRIYISK